jgi:DNA invertase Pin-like site-specific DNA recombinase
MRKVLLVSALFFMLIHAMSAFAKPERMVLKSDQRKAKEASAQAVIKNIRVGDIEDPAARKAIQEILNYLEMPYKK